MSEFLWYVLGQLESALSLCLLGSLGAVAALLICRWLYRKKYGGEKKFPWLRAIGWLVFAGYTLIVIYATFFRSAGHYRDWNFHLFRAWREAWNNFSTKNWANVLLNIAMFGPLGFLLPLLVRKFRRWYTTIPTGFALSLTIELLQLAFARGICDVDDLFANTLGTAMGYFAAMALLALTGPKGTRLKPALAYSGLLLIPFVAIGSIFCAYQLQEYGNLPNAPAYTNNTRNVQWILDCDLPEAGEQAPVYQTQALSRAQCDAFARELAASIGQEVDMISYYQEMVYYNLSGGILSVYYYDGSFELTINSWSGEGSPDEDRETVLQALAAFPVHIPESAAFEAEGDGWYSFTCDAVRDGAVLMDGTLRCYMQPDGTAACVNNHLVWYRYYQDAVILSPMEAYSSLCAGKFYDGGYFEYKSPAEVRVFSCRMDYEIDTKGFYQPVYLLDVASTDGNYQDCIMIPAMRP